MTAGPRTRSWSVRWFAVDSEAVLAGIAEHGLPAAVFDLAKEVGLAGCDVTKADWSVASVLNGSTILTVTVPWPARPNDGAAR